jgi:hypothetical protein
MEKITQMDIDLARLWLKELYKIMPIKYQRLAEARNVHDEIRGFIDKVEDLCVEEEYDDE